MAVLPSHAITITTEILTEPKFFNRVLKASAPRQSRGHALPSSRDDATRFRHTAVDVNPVAPISCLRPPCRSTGTARLPARGVRHLGPRRDSLIAELALYYLRSQATR